jgi:hypothetical protein
MTYEAMKDVALEVEELIMEIITLRFGEIPYEPCAELENSFAHMMADGRIAKDSDICHNSENNNPDRALTHLKRARLDCRKLLWMGLTDTQSFVERHGLYFRMTLGLEGYRMLVDDFAHELKSQDKKLREAREFELKNVGKDNEETSKKWDDIVVGPQKFISGCIVKRRILETRKYSPTVIDDDDDGNEECDPKRTYLFFRYHKWGKRLNTAIEWSLRVLPFVFIVASALLTTIILDLVI